MPAENEKKDHLPILGVGPAYVIAITVLTVACITLSKLGFLPYLRIRATVGVMHAVGTAFLIVVFGSGFLLPSKKSFARRSLQISW